MLHDVNLYRDEPITLSVRDGLLIGGALSVFLALVVLFL